MNQQLRDVLNDMYTEEDDVRIFDNPEYDDAILGISWDDRLIYDYEKMIECLIRQEGMTEEEAVDFVNYNMSFFQGNPIILLYKTEVLL